MNISSSFDKVRKAASKSLDRVMGVSGRETDPHLMTYGSLKPEHFDALVQKYGAENVIRYIKTMEARRLKGSHNG